MNRRTLLTLVVLVAFVAFLAWNTLSAQKVTCEVCVVHDGLRNCASASHETEPEALMSAKTTACGPVTHSMNDAIACQNKDMVSKRCETK